jgi:hypothetical protein
MAVPAKSPRPHTREISIRRITEDFDSAVCERSLDIVTTFRQPFTQIFDMPA